MARLARQKGRLRTRTHQQTVRVRRLVAGEWLTLQGEASAGHVRLLIAGQRERYWLKLEGAEARRLMGQLAGRLENIFQHICRHEGRLEVSFDKPDIAYEYEERDEELFG